ncbi:gluconate 5-dehydrogenase [Streptomyces sp. Ag82_O1-12]|uniref:SDR family oxidoreductase n=1 Tax=unclassified Streptomyces TaxID=2593676 RepID=UPI000BCCBF03|nr:MULTISPECIES: SDR family oxidoreductase [unclassified Streptomyces]SMQ20781.1 gluconate 5-dehydrogenase [Streptomyces sp. Ag82_O1-12]SOD49501.1 gluconate 5-dehydrogenase [Streptomyces sp. Ag82_G6-1]
MSHPLFDITGKTALVTGSSRGIGKALAKGLLEAGCTVVLNGRDTTALQATAAELADSFGDRVRTAAFDVTDSAAVTAAIARIEEETGPIDILVNNTGVQHRSPLLEFTDADWHRLLDTNLTSAFLVGREVARRMAPRGHGKIVNICSLQSEAVRPGIAAYSATKGGLKMLTKGMCADLGPLGIQVNGIGPGYFATELTSALVADEEFSAWVRRRTPAGRWGAVDDLVGALIFLASPASDFVGGQVLYVDGGMLSVL